MKMVKLVNLPIKWKRGTGLRKSDLQIDGENKCVLYGELFTKHKNVLIDSEKLSRTNKVGSVQSRTGDVLVPGTSTASRRDMILAREIDEDGVFLGGDINIIKPQKRIRNFWTNLQKPNKQKWTGHHCRISAEHHKRCAYW